VPPSNAKNYAALPANFVAYACLWLNFHKISSLLSSTGASRCNFRCGHQIPNILLQELVIAVQLIVFLLNCIDTIKYFKERLVEDFGMSVISILVSNLILSAADLRRGHQKSREQLRQTDCDNCLRASWPIFSRSSLVLRGDMARASSGSKVSSPS
jgi:hypothetical protein